MQSTYSIRFPYEPYVDYFCDVPHQVHLTPVSPLRKNPFQTPKILELWNMLLHTCQLIQFPLFYNPQESCSCLLVPTKDRKVDRHANSAPSPPHWWRQSSSTSTDSHPSSSRSGARLTYSPRNRVLSIAARPDHTHNSDYRRLWFSLLLLLLPLMSCTFTPHWCIVIPVNWDCTPPYNSSTKLVPLLSHETTTV